MRALKELARSYITITRDLTRVMSQEFPRTGITAVLLSLSTTTELFIIDLIA
jgi:hypothetical protein